MPIFYPWKRAQRRILSAPNDRLEIQLTKALHAATGPVQLSVDIQLKRGERLALLGPSGSGKTSLLRLLAGLLPADQGYINAFGKRWLDTATGICQPARQRRAGLVFQDYALFPHMTARGNLTFALPKGRPKARADELLTLMGLEQLAHHYPAQLSGGQQQRLALARALAAEPEVLLLDEPLSALDGALRHELQNHLLELHRRFNPTLILVSHDPHEAAYLTERAIVLEQGQIVLDGDPKQLWADPPALHGRILSQQPSASTHSRYLIELETTSSSPISLQPGDTFRLQILPPPENT